MMSGVEVICQAANQREVTNYLLRCSVHERETALPELIITTTQPKRYKAMQNVET